MLIMGHPQFDTQDDVGIGDGIAPIPEWQLDTTALQDGPSELEDLHIDYEVNNVFTRLRNVFHRAQRTPLPATRLHDLTCFVVHRLLPSASDTPNPSSSPITECVRYAILLYMFIVQGPTYYSHAFILNTMVTHFVEHVKRLELESRQYDSIDVWLFAVGMVASTGTTYYHWFTEKARETIAHLRLTDWSDVLVRIKSVLWLATLLGEGIFRPHWDAILGAADQSDSPDMTVCASSLSSIGGGFL